MNLDKLTESIDRSNKILIIQAENPDGDSVSSALALEQIFHLMGKEPLLYCPVQIPNHLRHLNGWDRVDNDLPAEFDMSIIVDTSSLSLLEKVLEGGNRAKITEKPVIIFDHHMVESDIDFDTINVISHDAVSTGELIYEISNELGWELDQISREMIASSIMYDSLGLTTDLTKPRSIHIIAELVEAGVKLPELDERRRDSMRKELELVHYKGELLKRVEVLAEGNLAYIHIPWEEIEQYSDKYNPSMLVIDDMRMIDGVKLAVALKSYPDGRITGKLRGNYGFDKASKIAESFGGGGHPYASGFKVRDMKVDEVKIKLIKSTLEHI